MRVFKTKWFERFARKNVIHDSMLIEAVGRAEKGMVDADLGGGIIKQRIARTGQGKSKGYRSIIIINRKEMAFFVFGFLKNDRDNLRHDEEGGLRDMAKYLLSIPEKDLSEGLSEGDFVEVKDD